MSDLMLLAVLEMPSSMWGGDALNIAQRESRYWQAAKRIRDNAECIESLESRCAALQAVVDELVAARDAFDANEPSMRVYDKQTARVQAAWLAARRLAQTVKG